MSFSDKFIKGYSKLLPSPFTIAIILTVITFILALVITKPENVGIGTYSIDLLKHWENGLWNNTSSGLYFAFQMMLMLVLGHIIALSKPVAKFINYIIQPCVDTKSTAYVVTISTIMVSLFNWGLGLIFGAILARKVGEKFNELNKPLNYPLIGAAAYSGLMVWHGGISGSAPIKASDEGNIPTLLNGMDVDLTTVPSRIDMSETVFSPMNIVVTIVLLIALPLLMYWIGRKDKPYHNLPKLTKEEDNNEEVAGAEKLDHSKILAFTIGGFIIFYAFHKAVIQPDYLSLKFLQPNFINLTLLGLSLIMHSSIHRFLKAGNDAILGATGILLQFPLYFGILGLMVGSGLIMEISDAFVDASNENTFPLYTFASAGIVNIFVPSGGGQWAVQGPIIIAAAQELGASYSKSIMALSYGDQLTNMLQPFWALPLLGITGLKAKDILPYTLILFLAGLIIFVLGLIIF
ncbi:TIGR00366 family protein [Paracrocinitomix mangrovi]|uniref:short-chain fatty acid transporter n=1 Tax=Paracrocinitomix mangrovi TaxID=2862509 RepID=UPI001C8ED30E|nr:TIGR00366 family protein [Paracrocinitomix mangrovi]UKN00484.1 TIGR00366 family protein [Paracrocinitomix mangrovi]